MKPAIANAKVEYFRKVRSSPKYVGWMCMLFSVLILGRAINDMLFFALAGVGFAVFVLSSVKHSVPLLFFLLPFSTILKQNTEAISLFTIFFFVVVLKMFLLNRKIEVKILVILIVFAVYNVVFSGIGQITTIVSMAAGSLMLYYIRKGSFDAKISVIAFSAGIILESALALWKKSLPIVNRFVNDTVTKLGDEMYADRFSGLQGNPNYYTLDIIIAISAIIVLMYNTKLNRIYEICIVVLSVFGLMSVSKSFLLAFALLIGCWFVLSLRQGAGALAKFMFIAVIGVAVAYFAAYDYINAYILRFTQDSTASLDEITTGRSDIWIEYIRAILGDFKIMFLGNGLKTFLKAGGKGTHNTYLETIFYLGVVGTGIVFASVRMCMGKISLRGAIWLPVAMLLVRMVAIGILTYDSIWFYLMIILLLAKESSKQRKYKNLLNPKT